MANVHVIRAYVCVCVCVAKVHHNRQARMLRSLCTQITNLPMPCTTWKRDENIINTSSHQRASLRPVCLMVCYKGKNYIIPFSITDLDK